MSGVGIDLLDVGRFERALERRPRLAERVFTDAEREYAAARARPAMHLAARFCAKEAVAKALGMTGWSFRDVEVVATGAAPEVRLSGSVAARAAELGRRAGDLAHAHRRRRGRRSGPAVTALPDWMQPVYEAAEMRAVDAWAIEDQGVPEADLMERAGLGLARVTAAVAGDGPVRIVVGKGNNGGDGRVAAPAAGGGRLRGRAAGRHRAVRARPARGLGRGGGRPARHGLRGRAARAAGLRDLGDQPAGRAGGCLRRALGRERLDRRGRGGGRARCRDRDLPRLEAGPAREPRQGARGPRGGGRDRDTARGAGPVGRRPDRRGRPRPLSPPHPQRLEVRLRGRGDRGRLDGAHGSADDGRALGRARGRRLRPGRRCPARCSRRWTCACSSR